MSARTNLSLAIPFLALAVGVAGCSRDAGESIRPAAPKLRTASIPIAASYGFQPGILLCVLHYGGDPNAVATDHGLVLTGSLPDHITYRMNIQPGQDLDEKEAEMAADYRVTCVTRDYLVQDSESRQSSMAFDE